MEKPVILTGVRSNAEPTLGNLLGVILPMVRLQRKHAKDYNINFFVPDLHSITTHTDYVSLYKNTINNVKLIVAAGLDINDPQMLVYRQSYIPAHSEMAWILECFAYYGELNRMTQFKDKVERIDFREELNLSLNNYLQMQRKFGENYTKHEYIDFLAMHFAGLKSLVERQEKEATVGLFNYPILMASDILLYGAKYVPVGEDQRQHLELARDIAIRMNRDFGNLFTVPEPWEKLTQFVAGISGVRIRSLKHPQFKMSKSVSDPAGTILLSDTPEQAKSKVLDATTDSIGRINYDFKNQSGVSNLLQIIGILENKTIEGVLKDWQEQTSYVKLKRAAGDLVAQFLSDIQKNLRSISDQDIIDKLSHDEPIAALKANATLLNVQRAVGLRPIINDYPSDARN
jgi:tryptophanyl-tRNA synthetase